MLRWKNRKERNVCLDILYILVKKITPKIIFEIVTILNDYESQKQVI